MGIGDASAEDQGRVTKEARAAGQMMADVTAKEEANREGRGQRRPARI